jgi:site-specific DNA-methyltransferase (adenine-specific)
VKPYYEDESVTLYHGDCLEIDAWLAADVLVTDPPYGMDYQGFSGRPGKNDGSRHGRIAGDRCGTSARDRVLALWGLSPIKPAAVFGTWKTPRPAVVSQLLIWHKATAGFLGDVNMPWGNVTEEIYIRGTGWTGRRESNVLVTREQPKQATAKWDHPTPKPVALLERIIEKAPPGTIADPFAGSGSTLVAARNLGRKAIGVEIEERYCETIAKRLAQGVLL